MSSIVLILPGANRQSTTYRGKILENGTSKANSFSPVKGLIFIDCINNLQSGKWILRDSQKSSCGVFSCWSCGGLGGFVFLFGWLVWFVLCLCLTTGKHTVFLTSTPKTRAQWMGKIWGITGNYHTEAQWKHKTASCSLISLGKTDNFL